MAKTDYIDAFLDAMNDEATYFDAALQSCARTYAEPAMRQQAEAGGDRTALFEAIRLADSYGVLRAGFREDHPDYAAYAAGKDAVGEGLRSMRAITNFMAQARKPDDPAWEAAAARYAGETLEMVDRMMEDYGGFDAVYAMDSGEGDHGAAEQDEVRDFMQLKEMAYTSILTAENLGVPMGDVKAQYPDYAAWAATMNELQEQAGMLEPDFEEEQDGLGEFEDLFSADVTRTPEPAPDAPEHEKQAEAQRQAGDAGHEAKAGTDGRKDARPQGVRRGNESSPNRRRGIAADFNVGGADEREMADGQYE